MNLSGPLDAKLCIICENLTKLDETRIAIFLSNSGLTPFDVRILQHGKIRPNHYLDKKETQPIPELLTLVEQVKESLAALPNLRSILVLDAVPPKKKGQSIFKYAIKNQMMYLLTGKSGIGKWRGSPIPFDAKITGFVEIRHAVVDVPLVPSYHPSFLIAAPDYRPIISMDFAKACRFTHSNPNQSAKKFNIYPTLTELETFAEDALASPEPLNTDIETASGKITRIAFAFKPNEAISIPFINVETGVSAGNDGMWPIIRMLLETKEIVGQNFGSYDRFWLEDEPYNCKNINLIRDTMVTQHVILPGLPKPVMPLGLAFLVSALTDELFHKDEAKEQEGKFPTDEEYGYYSCKDVDGDRQVDFAQINQPVYKRRKATIDFEMDVLNRTIRDIMRRGVRIDVAYKEELKQRAEKECEYLALRFHEEAGQEILLTSPTKLSKFFYDDLGLKGGKKKSTNEEALKILAAKYPDNKFLGILLKFRDCSTLLKNILSAELDPNGRLYASYRQATDTGRLQSNKSPYRRGYAFLTVDHRPMVRKMFIPDEGMIWITRDLSQAEAWAMYYLAGAESMLRPMREGKKPHQMMATWISGKRYEDVGKGTDEYGVAKEAIHGFNYLMGIRTFINEVRLKLGINMPEKDGRAIRDLYYSRVPELARYHQRIKYLLRTQNMTLTTPFGRERQFFGRGPNDYDVLKKAVAHVPQSFIGDLLNKIILKWYDIRTCGELLFPVTDETNTQCRPEEKVQHLIELDEAYNYPVDIGTYKNVVIPWDSAEMKNWGEEA